jgi:hypothetical protein
MMHGISLDRSQSAAKGSAWISTVCGLCANILKRTWAVRALKKIGDDGTDYYSSRGGCLRDRQGRIIRKRHDKYRLTIGGFEIFALSAPSRQGLPLLRLFVEHGLQVGGTCPMQLQTCTEQALYELVARVAAKRNMAAKPNGPWKAHSVHTEYECNAAGDIWSISNHQLMTKEPTADGYVSVYVNRMGYRAHRFVYEAFAGKVLEEGLHVHHKDGTRLNNGIANLEALAPQAHLEETRRANPGMHLKGGVTTGKAITAVNRVTGEKRTFTSACVAARELGMSQSHISRHLLYDQCTHVDQWVFSYTPAYLVGQEDLEGEEWRSIPAEGLASIGRETYDLSAIRVSNVGRVWDMKGRKSYGVSVKERCDEGNPYKLVGAGNCRIHVHTLVALAFIGPRPNTDHTVDHIDRVRYNNLPSNLRWADWGEQSANRNACVPLKKLDPTTGEVLGTYETLAAAAAAAVGVTKQSVSAASLDSSRICGGYRWVRARYVV